VNFVFLILRFSIFQFLLFEFLSSGMSNLLQ